MKQNNNTEAALAFADKHNMTLIYADKLIIKNNMKSQIYCMDWCK